MLLFRYNFDGHHHFVYLKSESFEKSSQIETESPFWLIDNFPYKYAKL